MKATLARVLLAHVSASALIILSQSGASAQNTKAQLTTLNNSSFIACGNGCIAGPTVNAFNAAVIASMGGLSDAQTWALQQTFTLSPIISSLIGSGTRCVTASSSGSIAATTNGCVSGPNSTTSGHLVGWGNTTGSALTDIGTTLPSGLTIPSPSISGLLSLSVNPAIVTPVADGQIVLTQNGTTTANSIIQDVASGFTIYDASRSVTSCNAGTTTTLCNAFGYYNVDNIPFGTNPGHAAVGLFGIAVTNVDGAHAWGINPACNDNLAQSPVTTNGRICIGAEFDYTLQSNNGGSGVEGISQILNAPNSQPTAANAFQVTAISVGKWVNGTVYDDNAIKNGGSAIIVGSNGAAGTHSIGSSPISFDIYDNSGTGHYVQLKGFPVGANGSLVLTDNTLSSGLAFELSNSDVSIFTACASCNLSFTASGGGSVTTNSNLAVSSGLSVSSYSVFSDNTAVVPSAVNVAMGITTNQATLGETEFWNLQSSATDSFRFNQITGAGTFSTLLDISASGIKTPGLVATAVAPTVAASQIGYGSTVSANTSCGTLAGSAGCVVINVAGTTRYIPYY